MTTVIGTGALAGAVVLGGLLAGIYAGFSVGVMPGLALGSDATLVSTMQQINRAIVSPAFLLVFFGAPLVAVGAAILRPSVFTIAGAVLAVVTLVVTIAVNIPLNDALDTAQTATAAQLSQARAVFEVPWTRANLIRTLTGVLAAALPAVDLVRASGRG